MEIGKKQTVAGAKPLVAGLRVTMLSLLLFSFKSVNAGGELRIEPDKNEATNVSGTTSTQTYPYWGAKVIRNTVVNRFDAGNYPGAYTTLFVNLEAVVDEYRRCREKMRPPAPRLPKTCDQIRAELLEQTKKQLADLQNTCAKVPRGFKNAYNTSVKILEKQLDDYADPNNRTVLAITENGIREYNLIMQRYKEKLQKWEIEYPRNQLLTVKIRLEQFPGVTNIVNFTTDVQE